MWRLLQRKPMMSFMESFLATRKPKFTELSKTINRQTIVDVVASWLYAASIVNDNQEITNIEFGDLAKKQVPMKIFIKEVTSKK
jgi:hypothetical protein